MADQGVTLDDGNVKLFIQEIRQGSIEIDLVDLVNYSVAMAPVVAANFNAVLDFAEQLKRVYDWLTRGVGEKPAALNERPRIQNFRQIVEPVAKDNNGSLIFQPIICNNTAPVTIHIGSLDANAAQNSANRLIEAMAEPVCGLHERVLLRWYQTRNDAASDKGDMAIVESVSARPIKTVFLGESLKVRMLNLEENIYRQAFLVDVIVESLRGRPALFKISQIHDTVDIPT
jgi:hypothetical protein